MAKINGDFTENGNMLQVFANIIAKNPPSILIVLGVLLHLVGDGLGAWLIGFGILLNVVWLVK